MIGQKKIQKTLHDLIERKKFPRFSIIVGEEGSGKKTLVRECIKPSMDFLPYFYAVEDVKMDTIRWVIEKSYQMKNTLFFLPDADNMYVPAKNAMLKVTEETPNGNYFIMTLKDEGNTLDTVLSRATVFHMDVYSPDEIADYYNQVSSKPLSKELPDITKCTYLCRVPGEVNKIKDNIDAFYEYVGVVIDNIHKVSGANSFKIADKIALNGEDDKYDLVLFLRAFNNECLARHIETMNNHMYSKGVIITSKYLTELWVSSVNKRMVFDNWLLDIRAEWLQYADN